MPRGSKTCPQCNKSNGPRTYVCECGYSFIFKPNTSATQKSKTKGKYFDKNKLSRYKPVDIADLVKGDTIKVKPGSYYESKEGNKYYMGEKGTFTFIKTIADGILAHSRKYGVAYLYMGPPSENKLTGTRIRPHRIKRLVKIKK